MKVKDKETPFIELRGNDVFVLAEDVDQLAVWINEERKEIVLNPLIKALRKNMSANDYVIFVTGARGTTLVNEGNNGLNTYELNPKQERAINKVLDFWPSGKDYPKWGYILVFKTLELKTIFEVSKGFGVL